MVKICVFLHVLNFISSVIKRMSCLLRNLIINLKDASRFYEMLRVHYALYSFGLEKLGQPMLWQGRNMLFVYCLQC